jgi:hypothetical protein
VIVDDDLDDAADTLRFVRLDLDGDTDPDVTSIYDFSAARRRHVGRSVARRLRLVRETRQNVARLREALASGWDIGPELAHEERQLAALEAA